VSRAPPRQHIGHRIAAPVLDAAHVDRMQHHRIAVDRRHADAVDRKERLQGVSHLAEHRGDLELRVRRRRDLDQQPVPRRRIERPTGLGRRLHPLHGLRFYGKRRESPRQAMPRSNASMPRGNDSMSWGNGLMSWGNGLMFWGNGLMFWANGLMFWANGSMSQGNVSMSQGNVSMSQGNDSMLWGNVSMSWSTDSMSRSNGPMLWSDVSMSWGNGSMPRSSASTPRSKSSMPQGNSSMYRWLFRNPACTTRRC